MTVKRVRVFVASPGDLGEERQRAALVVEELNRSFGKSLNLALECIRWETHVAPQMGRPQEIILKQLDVESTDIFVGMLWLRFGSPTGASYSKTGEDFQSGTQEEFSLAYDSWLRNQRPLVMFYQCTRAPADMSQVDPDQFKQVREFMKQFGPSGSHPGLYRSFGGNAEEFERRFREDLIFSIRELFPDSDNRVDGVLPRRFQQQGIKRIILPGAMGEREKTKRETLSNARVIRLIAHSGYSFLAQVGHRYRDSIEERLSQGATVQVLLTNPWSIAGLTLALAELDGPAVPVIRDDGALSGVAVGIIEKSAWYSLKLRDAILGFERLRQRYGSLVDVRFSPVELCATILITELACFLEPYVNVNLQERHKIDMISFEIEADAHSHLHRHVNDYFTNLWDVGLAFDEYQEREDLLRSNLAGNLQALRPLWT